SYREFIGTFFDGGEVPIEGNFIPTDTNGQMGLAQDFAAKTLQNFEIIFPNGASFAFSALVTRIKVADATIDGVLGFSATLKVSGKPVLSATFAPDLTGLVVTTGVLVPTLTASKYDYVAIIGT